MKRSKLVFFSLTLALAIAPTQTAWASGSASASAVHEESALLSDEDAADLMAEVLTEEDSTFEEDFIISDDEDTDFSEETVEENDETETIKETKNEKTDDLVEEESETVEVFAVSIDLSEFKNQKVAEFVVRMYDKFLQRKPDKAGLKDWYDRLMTGKDTGASVIEGFINSKEFIKRNLDDSDFLDIMYNGIFGRNPDAGGKNNWMNTLSKGVSRNYIAYQFINSKEFTNLCNSYGITKGEIFLSENRDQNILITEFVNNFYLNCLDRPGEPGGLNDWTGSLLSAERTGVDIVNGFLFSNEFTAKGLNDSAYIETLYKAILGRGSDAAGKTDWLNHLANGVSRYYIAAQFLNSQEFKNVCDKSGIKKGDPVLSENRDQNYPLTTFCNDFYKNALKRTPSAGELNTVTGQCLNVQLTGRTLAECFFDSSEYKSQMTSDESFIKDVYKSLFGRTPSAAEISEQVAYMKNSCGNDRDKMLSVLIDSDEYRARCEVANLPVDINAFIKRHGKTYYYNSNGQIHTGWLRTDGKRYYMDPTDGGAMVTGWKYIDGYKFYFYEDGVMATDLDDIIGPQSSYYIHVYKWGNYVIVFAKDGANGYIIPCKVMICSCGVNTPTGTYWSPATYRWLTMVGGSKAQWCTQIMGDYLFHSIPYVIADNTAMYTDMMYNKLGTTQSLGCIRLQAGYAKWVYDHCGAGTQIYIDPYNNEGPFDKPYFETIPSWHGWDPTDPTANYLCEQHGCHHNIQMP